MMKKLLVASAAIAACMTLAAHADWADDFDSYTDGQWLDGDAEDGGWKGWADDPGAGAQVTSLYSYSPPHSVDIAAATDLVHEYDYSSGEWLYTGWVYVPAGFSGETSYMLLSHYNDEGVDLVWSLWVQINDQGIIHSENDGGSMEYQTDQWMEFTAWIDLEDDRLVFFVDDWPLVDRAWSDTYDLGGGGPMTVQAIDLFPDGATSIYVDEMSMQPVPGGECPWDNAPYNGPDDYGDGLVNIDDVFGILGYWGPCDDPEHCPWDCFPEGGPLAGDGEVNIDDLFAVLGHWGDCPAGTGACCFDTEPQCFDLKEDACIIAGGTFYGTFNHCDDFICPPPPDNDNCDDARPISIDGPSVVETTVDMGNPGIGGCGSAADPLAGTRFYYVIGDGRDLTASLCYGGATEPLDWDLSVYCSYCSSLMCVAGNDGSNNPDCFVPPDLVHPEVTWCAEPGVIYYIAVYGASVGVEGVFELSVYSGDPCDDFPVCGCEIFCDGTPEGEPCLENGDETDPTVDVTNGGCNACDWDRAYGSISDGETVCGSVSNYSTPADSDCDGALDMLGDNYIFYNYRDTDWYRLNIPEGSTGGAQLDIEFNAEFPGLVGVLLDDCDVSTFISYTTTAECVPVTLTLPWLFAGDYIVFVAPSIFEGIGCAYNDYSVKVTLTEVSQPECQGPDLDGTAVTSDISANDSGGYMAAEDFNVEVDTTINEVGVWAIAAFHDGSDWLECDGTKNSFTVKYYQDTDGNGCPDDGVYAEFDIDDATVADDGTWGSYTLWRYDMSHADLTLDGGYCYWLEVVGQDENEDCWFLWVTSLQGNLRAIQSSPPDYACPGDYRENEDQSMCIGYNGAYILFGNPWLCR